MPKKLTVEVDAETTKAKRKLKELATEGTAGSADAGGRNARGAASAVADQADATAKSLKRLDDSTGSLNGKMVNVTRAFAGMAVGMAASYASRYFAEGSTGRNVMDYSGAIMTGASGGAAAGMALGPKGAVVGGIIGGASGAVNTYMSKDSAVKDGLKDFEKSEKIFESVKAWQQKLRELTEHLDRDEVQQIIDNLKKSETLFKAQTTTAIKEGRFSDAADLQRNLGDVRSRTAALEQLLRNANKAPSIRESTSALDSLSRLGAGGFGGGDYARQQLETQKEQLSVLKSIEQKSGGATWQ